MDVIWSVGLLIPLGKARGQAGNLTMLATLRASLIRQNTSWEGGLSDSSTALPSS